MNSLSLSIEVECCNVAVEYFTATHHKPPSEASPDNYEAALSRYDTRRASEEDLKFICRTFNCRSNTPSGGTPPHN